LIVMPELPEVETAVRALRPQIIGRRVVGTRLHWPRHIDRPDLLEFQARINGLTFLKVHRRAKFIVFNLDQGETLLVHLRMTGHLAIVSSLETEDKHSHTVFELDNGQELRFRDTRKFGRVYLVEDPAEVLGDLGPEPLEPSFTPEVFQQMIVNRKRIVKPCLLDQRVIAGIGNIYADEALFHAGVHPTRRTDTLTNDEITALHKGIREVLLLGIEREGASISTYLKPDGEKGEMQNEVKVFRRTGQTCFRCGHTIERMTLGGRSTHYCPSCQK